MPYAPALAQRWFPARTWPRECAVVALGAAVVALLAQVSVPLQPVPLTGQTLGVLLVGSWLGMSRGAASLALYVAAGAGGLPVFAGGAFGPQVLAGTTGGYLVGFVVSAALVGFMAEAGFLKTFPRAVPAMFLASVPIHALGLLWLSRFVPERALLDIGFWPFVAFDPLKLGLAAAIVSGTSRITSRSGR
jgi:biotin transport system substrate-specific component